MNESPFESECESDVPPEEGDSHTAGFREKCQRLLLSSEGDDDLSAHADHEDPNHPTCVQCVHIGLQRYGEEQSVQQCWMDVDTVKGRLLIEIKSWSKAPILSEKCASKLLMWEDPDQPCHRLGEDKVPLKPADLDQIYWHWKAKEACESSIDDQVCYRVIVKRGGVRKPSRIRTCWLIPLLVRAEEVRFAVPLIDCFEHGDGAHNIYFTLNDEQKCVLQLQRNKNCLDAFERYYTCDYLYVMISYKVFDSVVPNWVVEVCFDVLMQKLDFGMERQTDWVTVKEGNKETNKTRYRMMVEHFLAVVPIKVCQAEGLQVDEDVEQYEYTIAKTRGILGDSCFTRIIRTMSNFLMTWLILDLIFGENKPFSYRFHGSKCCLVFKSKLEMSLCAFAQCAETYFGLVVDMNRSCSAATIEDFHTLKYCCGTDGDDDDDD